jgi:hypothetical protein
MIDAKMEIHEMRTKHAKELKNTPVTKLKEQVSELQDRIARADSNNIMMQSQ